MHSAKILNKQMDTVYGLYLPVYNVPTPEAQTNYVEIPGKNGALDKTGVDGVVYFKDREWTLEFQKTGSDVSGADLLDISSDLYNDLHGRQGEIIFDDDTSYKWIGRVFIDDVVCENNGLIIATIRLITEPFKYGVTNVTKTATLSSTASSIVLKNGRKPLVPSITVTDSATLTFTIKGNEYTAELASGTWTVADLVLFEGNTTVSVTGTGSITFTYPEALL